MNYMNGGMRVENKKYKGDPLYIEIKIYVFCASSACGVSVEHMNAKETSDKECISFPWLLSHPKDIKNTSNSTTI